MIITQNQEIVIDYADKLEMPIHDTSISYDEDYFDYSDEDDEFDYNFDEDYDSDEDEDYSDEEDDDEDNDEEDDDEDNDEDDYQNEDNDEDDYQNEDNDEDKKDDDNNQYKGEDFDHNYEDEYYEDNDEDDYQNEDNDEDDDEDYRQVGCHQNDEYNDAWSAFQSYLDKQEADILNFLQLPEDCIEDMKTVARENNLDWLTHLKEINLEFRPTYQVIMPLRPLVDEINEEAIIIEDQESYKKMLDDELTGIENDIKSWNEFLARKQFKNDYQLICDEEDEMNEENDKILNDKLTSKFWDEFHSDYKMTLTQEEENAKEEFWRCMEEDLSIYK